MDRLLWFPSQLYIDGAWTDADSGSRFAVTNPATGEEIGTAPRGDENDAVKAVEAAAAALPAWRRLPGARRAELVKRIGELLLEHRDALATLLTTEQGKPLAQAKGEVEYAASFYRWFAEEGRRIAGYGVPHRDTGKRTWTEYHPVGVVAAVTPWNFPLAQGAKKLAAALAAGCTTVLKPASHTPLMSCAMAWIGAEAGLPPGVLNVVCGDARAIGRVFTSHPAVRSISLTGSTATGAALMSQAGAQIKRTSMELGGNSPFIVLDDANLDRAAGDLIRVKFMSNGQMCVTANRIFVQEPVYDAFRQRVVERVKALVVGNGLDSDVDVGPLISHDAVAAVNELVEDAVAAGARLLVGGPSALPESLRPGSFYPPTVLEDAADGMRIAREEIFGPVIPLFRFVDDEEVVRRSNDTEYGLAAYVYAGSLDRGVRVARAVEAGIVGINDMRPLRAEVPFGGVKKSGVGREGGREGIEEFLEVRVFSSFDPAEAT
jgi:succinate-semialdehyde dehydrogenase / glutarate-semialdehyde dehydrogenase